MLFDKYKAISQKLIDIVDDESRDLTLSFFELTGCDCVWVNLWSRVDSYIQKVNKKIGRPILGAVSLIHHFFTIFCCLLLISFSNAQGWQNIFHLKGGGIKKLKA